MIRIFYRHLPKVVLLLFVKVDTTERRVEIIFWIVWSIIIKEDLNLSTVKRYFLKKKSSLKRPLRDLISLSIP